MEEKRADAILQILQQTFTMPKWASTHRGLFETLIVTIISQNTAYRNTAKAFERLSKRFAITPKVLAKAELSQFEDALRVDGLYKNKAKTIKTVSTIIADKFHGSMQLILSPPFEEARETLMTLPGVELKTADVVLLFSATQLMTPVYTPVNRVAKRLDFVSATGNYEAIHATLQALYNPCEYLAVHIVLLMHGRWYYRAKRSLCSECPINIYCPSRGIGKND